MANWKSSIDITESWNEDPPNPIKVAKDISRQLKNLPKKLKDEQLESLITDFDTMVDDLDYFNEIMTKLYDWGDYDHRLFINWFGSNGSTTMH